MMKRILLGMLLLLTLSYACESDDDNDPKVEDTFVRAAVDGNNWEATEFQGSYINEIVSIEAEAADGTVIEIAVQNVLDKGTYALGNVSVGVYEEGNGNDETFATSGALGSGTITFSVLNRNRAEGNFSFVGGNGLGDSISISSGSFEIDLSN